MRKLVLKMATTLGTTVKPPQLDEFFLAEEVPLRAEELAALGPREADIRPGLMVLSPRELRGPGGGESLVRSCLGTTEASSLATRVLSRYPSWVSDSPPRLAKLFSAAHMASARVVQGE